MSFRFRDVAFDDLDTIQEFNRMAGVSVAPIDRSTLIDWFETASYFRVAEIDGDVAGFLIGSDHNAPIGNAGFRWFRERYPAFAYIDRIVVAERYRGHGLGRILYADIISFAEVRVPVLGCQISLEPQDDASFMFHASLGFHEVAQLASARWGRVSVMERGLCSYPFVRQRYLEEGSETLPNVPWLADRAMPVATMPILRTGSD